MLFYGTNQSLEVLDLMWKCLGLAETSKTSKGVLNLSWNGSGAAGVEAVRLAFKVITTLRVLDLI